MGSFATRSIQAFDFDASGCAAGCKDPGAGYVPNEVVPDGEGGSLATWTGNDSQLGITSSSAALVRHFDNASGILDYVVPFASSSWFRVGGDNPQALVVGENGTAFASDGQSMIAFDVNTGAQQWSFQPGGFQGTALMAATAQGGVAAVQLADFQGEVDATPNALLSFDSGGGATPTPFLGGNSNLNYFDSNTVLAVSAAQQGERLTAPALFDPKAVWDVGGNMKDQRVPLPGVPDHLQVLTDSTAALTSCPTIRKRQITYAYLDARNKPVDTVETSMEQFAAVTPNSCGTGLSLGNFCRLDTGFGEFQDTFTVGCNSVGGNCGFHLTKPQWLVCPSGGDPYVVATIGDDDVRQAVISVGGNLIGFIPGTMIFPDGTQVVP